MASLVSDTDYAESIRTSRSILKLTQNHFARLMQVTQATVARWEQGALVPDDVKNQIDKLFFMIENDERNWLLSALLLDDGIDAIAAILRLSKFRQTQITDSNSKRLSVNYDSGKLVCEFIEKHRGIAKTADLKIVNSHSKGSDMSLTTNGFKEIGFNYSIDKKTNILTVINDRGRVDTFRLDLISDVLNSLYEKFGFEEFPLANNVQNLGNNTEVSGLGKTIYELNGKDIKNAQASSYLGPILEQIGLLKWNGVRKGIKWHLLVQPPGETELSKLLAQQ